MIWWYVFVSDDMKSSGAIDAHASALFSNTNTLIKTSHFIGKGVVPDLGELGVGAKLLVVENFAILPV